MIVPTERGFPRRAQMLEWVPAEKAIHDAVQAVESMPADPRLTDAVILLGKAKDRVSDFVDKVDGPPQAEQVKMIVAEISKGWKDGEHVSSDTRMLSEKFEEVISVNAYRGYRLHSWRMHSATAKGQMSETIVAVFEQVA